MKQSIPLQLSKTWNVASIVVELVVICLIVAFGLQPPDKIVSAGLILIGLLSGALCNYLFIIHLTEKLCERLPECKPLCAEANKGRKIGSRAMGLFFVIIAIAFIIVWPMQYKPHSDPAMRTYDTASWFLAFICAQSLWFDLSKFRYLWSRKGILRTLTK